MDLICIYLKVATGCDNFYMLSTIKKFQTIFEKFSIHRICKHFETTEPRLNLYTQKMRAKNQDKSRLTALKNAGDRDRTFWSLANPVRKGSSGLVFFFEPLSEPLLYCFNLAET